MNNPLRDLPNMNSLLEHPLLEGQSALSVKYAARETLDELRETITSGETAHPPTLDECAALVLTKIQSDTPNLRGLINATGIILHTNLGRAPIGEEILKTALETCSGYCNLEYDLETGLRGDRYTHVENLITQLTGAESAMVVNNNAAAVVLMLSAIATNKKVAISRGELVEIGGSFRIPEIIAHSGAELLEIGTTNKTRLSDYTEAIETKGAQALLKVHTSNFEIIGFTETVPIRDLAQLGKTTGTPVLYDMGACFLINLEELNKPHQNNTQHPTKSTTEYIHNYPPTAEPPAPIFQTTETAKDAITSGADIICFSGDKLLGAAQSGIIAGRNEYITAMKKHPLARTLRPDKLTLSILETTLRIYKNPEETTKHIPILTMLNTTQEQLKQRATQLAQKIKQTQKNWQIQTQETTDETGGGSLPNKKLPGWAITITPKGITTNQLEETLRKNTPPIIIRTKENKAHLSLRTIQTKEENEIIKAIKKIKT